MNEDKEDLIKNIRWSGLSNIKSSGSSSLTGNDSELRFKNGR